MTEVAARRSPARDRLLESASELFYAEGIHRVGIDRVIEHAGVAKASLYSSFGSKDELVRAYLQQRHAISEARLTEALTRWESPRDKLLGVFVVQAERMAEPEYHGCPFIGASVESPAGSPARQATADYRDWQRELMADLARDAGASDPEALSRQLQMLYDGAALGFRIDGNPASADLARAAAAALVDAAVAA